MIKQVPITIKTQLSNHSSNKIVFCHAAEDYEKALKNEVIMSSYSTNQQIRIQTK